MWFWNIRNCRSKRIYDGQDDKMTSMFWPDAEWYLNEQLSDFNFFEKYNSSLFNKLPLFPLIFFVVGSK